MESIVQRHMSRNGADLDLVGQLTTYEKALKAEDGDSAGGSSDIRYVSLTCICPLNLLLLFKMTFC